MTQDDVYRHVGRGGAGNFFTKSTAQTQGNSEKDLEAQPQPLTPATTATSSQVPSHPARAGRGGAGNFNSSSDAAEHERIVAQDTAQAVKASSSSRPAHGGYAGRGGAGNWKEKDEKKDGGEEKGRLEEIERKAKEVVDQGLRMPERVVMAKDKKKGLGLNGGEH